MSDSIELAGNPAWVAERPAGTTAEPSRPRIGAATFIDPKHTVVLSGSQQVGETPALGLSGFIGVRVRVR
jgi:hypothetical protein